MSLKWSARADFGTAMWTFQDRDPWDLLLGQESVRVDRLTLSAVSHGSQQVFSEVLWTIRATATAKLLF